MNKRNIIKLIILILLMNCLSDLYSRDYKFDIDSNWTYYYPAENLKPERFQCINFIDSLNGFACFNFLNDFHARIIRTTNGGITWKMVLDDISTYKTDSISGKKSPIHIATGLNELAYIDTNLIIGIMASTTSGDIPPYCAVSRNNGITWDYTYLTPKYHFLEIAFWDKKRGFILSPSAKMFSTTDTAKTWKDFEFQETLEGDIYDLKMFSDSTLVAFTRNFINKDSSFLSDFYICKTNNLGKSWESYKCPDSIYGLMEIDFLNENVFWYGGYILPKDSSMQFYKLKIYKTTDAGMNWILQLDTISSTKKSIFPCRIKFWDMQNGMFIGFNSDVLITSDGGQNWVRQDKAPIDSKEFSPLHFIDACFLNKDKIIALSEYGYIFKYERKSSTQVESTSNYKDYLLISPNPASEHININFVEPTNLGSLKSIDIYNIFGEIMKSTNRKNLTPIMHEHLSSIVEKEFEHGHLRVDILDLAAGVYVVVVNDGNELKRSLFVKE